MVRNKSANGFVSLFCVTDAVGEPVRQVHPAEQLFQHFTAINSLTSQHTAAATQRLVTFCIVHSFLMLLAELFFSAFLVASLSPLLSTWMRVFAFEKGK